MNLAQIRAIAEKQPYNITAEEAKDFGPINRISTWETAMRNRQSELEEQSAQCQEALVERAYRSPSAPLVIPAAVGLAAAQFVFGALLPRRPRP